MSSNAQKSKESDTIVGVTNQFQWATKLVAEELHFVIAGEAMEFRMALDRAGQRRFEHCVWLVKHWSRPYHKGAAKYDRLMHLLRLVTPEKAPGTKYRNPQLAKAHVAQEALNAEFADAMRRDP